MPEGRQAATTPIMLTVASTNGRGGPLARAQPGLQLAKELIDVAGQPNQLLMIGRAVQGFHLLADYTSAVSLDVSGCYGRSRHGRGHQLPAEI